MSSSSISSSLRLFTTKIPSPKILFPHKPHNLSSFFKPISFQRLPTTPSPSLASASSSPSASSSTPLQSIEELPPKLQEIIKLFQSVQEPKAKYEQLLFYGKNLKPLETQFKTKDNKVSGCVSQVWVRAYLDKDENVVFEADSDSVLTKGLAALLVNGLSGRPVDEILRVSPDFAMLLGLQQSLTPSRNNGFLNMLRLMQKKALHLVVEAQKGKNSESEIGDGVKDVSFGLDSNVGVEENLVGAFNSELKIDEGDKNLSFGLDSNVGVEENPVGISNSGLEIDGSVEDVNGRLDSDVGVEKDLNLTGKESNSGGLGSRGIRIKEKLEKELSPVELEIEDISYQHAGHAGARGSDGETHFNVKVVSNEFEGKSLVKRHRLVYGLLQEELQSGLHALSIVAKTPSEVNGR